MNMPSVNCLVEGAIHSNGDVKSGDPPYEHESRGIQGTDSHLRISLSNPAGSIWSVGMSKIHEERRHSLMNDSSAFVSSSFLWFLYGTLIEDQAITLVNIFGFLFFSSYVVAYVTFSTKKVTVMRHVLVVVVLTCCIFVYIRSLDDLAEAKRKLGIVACGVSVSFFAAPLANLAHVIKSKSSESLPLPIIFMSMVVTFLWSTYGYILQDKFVAYPNMLAFLLSTFQMSLFLIYPSR
ncbi:hypothetical protein GE061_015618 [Apolygus lucorum]|uniref:Sugar transporter SWEET n=1 Tax=Apolygus lucorum TaxID=248454 RepID=A0A8S9XQK1_APOLU|nr:hypothetical protein GE061_015618 [Apolygus lucorum]